MRKGITEAAASSSPPPPKGRSTLNGNGKGNGSGKGDKGAAPRVANFVQRYVDSGAVTTPAPTIPTRLKGAKKGRK